MTLDELQQALGPALEELTSGQIKRQVRAQGFLLERAEEPPLRAAIAERVEPLLTHPDSQVRGTVYLALAAARGEGAMDLLAPRADDPVSGARCALAQAASTLGAAGRSLLRRLVQDPVFAVRLEAGLGLAELRDDAGIDALVQGLTDSSLRFEVLQALQSLGDARAREPVRRFFKRFFLPGWERIAAAGVLARLGEVEGRDFLVSKIQRGKGDELGLAIEIAGDLKLEAAREGLWRIAGLSKHPFRGAALRALGMLGDASALEPASRSLLDEAEDAAVRMDAAECLMHLDTPRAREVLDEASRAVVDGEVAAVVREALASLGSGRSPG